jgi:hypothetical protein
MDKVLLSVPKYNIPLIKKPLYNYNVYKVVPGRFNLENKKTIEEILTTISALIEPSISIKDRSLIYNTDKPIYYEILYKDRQVSFNYVIPDTIDKILVNKIDKVFKMASIEPIEDYFPTFEGKHYTTFSQKSHFLFSLDADYREGGLTEGLLSIINNIDSEDDQLLFQIGIIPLNDNWKEKWRQAYVKQRKGGKLDNQANIGGYIFDKGFEFAEQVFGIFDMAFNIRKEESKNDGLNTIRDRKVLSDNIKVLSNQSYQKINYNGYLTQIKIYCSNELKVHYYTRIFDSVLKVLDHDQELRVNKTKQQKGNRHFDFQITKNIFSTKELSLFLQLPSIKMQLEYRDRLRSIEYRETDVPEELQSGYIPIGASTYKGVITETFFCKKKNILVLPKVVVGPMNSGKSEFTKRFSISASKGRDSIIVLDYVQNCELSNTIAKHIDCIVFDLSKQIDRFALAYPEIQPDESDSWSRLQTANILSRQIEFIINSLSTEPLSPRMVRYLDAACKVVYIHKGKRLLDVINVLTNHVTRGEFIKRAIESTCFTEDDNEIVDLKSLHEYDHQGNINGTRDNKIDGILDRSNVISKDIFLRTMMKTKIDYEINFTEYMDKGKAILIQVPEHTFTNKQIKDTLVTYLMSRIWLSALRRKNPGRLCHIITDEVHQIPTCASLISNVITESRKFGVSFYFTIHYLKQFKTLLDAIKSSGVSYMLLAGTEKENFTMLQEEFDPFELEDVMRLKPYTSLNRINCGGEYVKYISKLPKLV